MNQGEAALGDHTRGAVAISEVRIVGTGFGRRRIATGFTLVELLVVVSIIGLLIAILVPTLSRARKQVSSVVCRSNIKQLMNGQFYYIADYGVFPGTHSLFFMQRLFSAPWPRISGVTWDGARDRLNNDFSFTDAYKRPYHLDPEFIADVPGRGTVFPYVKDEGVYVCPSDKPGEANDTPVGGGGNGRLSYSLNAYVGYKSPEQLGGFTYVADVLDLPLPGGEQTRSFHAGQHVVFPASRFMTMFEEHPNSHMNTSFPEGNFNGLDRIATRHMPSSGAGAGAMATGKATIAYLDGHAESPTYPAKTEGRQLFAEIGQPHWWPASGGNDNANMSVFIPRLAGHCPW